MYDKDDHNLDREQDIPTWYHNNAMLLLVIACNNVHDKTHAIECLIITAGVRLSTPEVYVATNVHKPGSVVLVL